MLSQIDPRIGVSGSHHLEQDSFDARALLLRISFSWNDQKVESFPSLLIDHQMPTDFLRPLHVMDGLDHRLDFTHSSLEQKLNRNRIEGVLVRLVAHPPSLNGMIRDQFFEFVPNVGYLISRSLYSLEGE